MCGVEWCGIEGRNERTQRANLSLKRFNGLCHVIVLMARLQMPLESQIIDALDFDAVRCCEWDHGEHVQLAEDPVQVWDKTPSRCSMIWKSVL